MEEIDRLKSMLERKEAWERKTENEKERLNRLEIERAESIKSAFHDFAGRPMNDIEFIEYMDHWEKPEGFFTDNYKGFNIFTFAKKAKERDDQSK